MKGKNLIGTVPITVSTTRRIEIYLEELVHSGLYGKNTAEAAERVIVIGLERLFESNRLTRKPHRAGK